MRILALAPSGFGKSLSACGCVEPELGINIEGLDPNVTYFISVTSKNLPRRGSALMYPIVEVSLTDNSQLPYGRRVITNDAYLVAFVIRSLIAARQAGSPIINIVIDDANYLMQDYMMQKSLAQGWDAPKKVGHFMSDVFAAMEEAEKAGLNVIMLAHYETTKADNLGNVEYSMKTTGNTVDRGITPEGKFDITLFGITKFNTAKNVAERFYVTNNNGKFEAAKSAPGMFPMYIPNDLGFAMRCISAYYTGQPMPVVDFEQPNFQMIIPTLPVAPPTQTTPAATVPAQPVAPPIVAPNFNAQSTPAPVQQGVAPIETVQPAPSPFNPPT